MESSENNLSKNPIEVESSAEEASASPDFARILASLNINDLQDINYPCLRNKLLARGSNESLELQKRIKLLHDVSHIFSTEITKFETTMAGAQQNVASRLCDDALLSPSLDLIWGEFRQSMNDLTRKNKNYVNILGNLVTKLEDNLIGEQEKNEKTVSVFMADLSTYTLEQKNTVEEIDAEMARLFTRRNAILGDMERKLGCDCIDECKICATRPFQPTIDERSMVVRLVCGHKICVLCLLKCLRVYKDFPVMIGVKCPWCRRMIIFPNVARQQEIKDDEVMWDNDTRMLFFGAAGGT